MEGLECKNLAGHGFVSKFSLTIYDTDDKDDSLQLMVVPVEARVEEFKEFFCQNGLVEADFDTLLGDTVSANTPKMLRLVWQALLNCTILEKDVLEFVQKKIDCLSSLSSTLDKKILPGVSLMTHVSGDWTCFNSGGNLNREVECLNREGKGLISRVNFLGYCDDSVAVSVEPLLASRKEFQNLCLKSGLGKKHFDFYWNALGLINVTEREEVRTILSLLEKHCVFEKRIVSMCIAPIHRAL